MAGVAHGQILDAHDEKWGVVDEQREASVLLDDVRHGGGLRLRECGGGREKEKSRCHYKVSQFHIIYLVSLGG